MLLDCILMFVNVSYLMYFQHIIHVYLRIEYTLIFSFILQCNTLI